MMSILSEDVKSRKSWPDIDIYVSVEHEQTMDQKQLTQIQAWNLAIDTNFDKF